MAWVEGLQRVSGRLVGHLQHATPAVGTAHGCRNQTEPMDGQQAGGVMWEAGMNLGSIPPAQHTHTKAPYAQIIKAESQVQHGQARLHSKSRHPRPKTSRHCSILPCQLPPIDSHIRQQTRMHRGSQCGVSTIPSLTATPTGPALHARTCYQLARAMRLAGVWGRHVRSIETTAHLNRRSAPVIRPSASTGTQMHTLLVPG